jgi:hypothetical protein
VSLIQTGTVNTSQVNALLFAAEESEGKLISLSIKRDDDGQHNSDVDVNLAHVLLPPWNTKEFYVGMPDGQLALRYTAITRQSSRGPVSVVFRALNPNSAWQGDMVVLRHVHGQVSDLTSIGADEIPVLTAAIAAIGRN